MSLVPDVVDATEGACSSEVEWQEFASVSRWPTAMRPLGAVRRAHRLPPIAYFQFRTREILLKQSKLPALIAQNLAVTSYFTGKIPGL